MSESLENNIFSEVQFRVGQEKKSFTVNAYLLCKSSPVFKAMICGEFKQQGPIEIPDIEPPAFETMLKNINKKKITFTNMDHAEKVLYAADKYDLSKLKSLCAEYIYPTTLDDVWTALECGLFYNIDLLKNAALKMIRNNTYGVLTSKHFSSLSKSALKIILQDDQLDVNSEVEVLEAVMYWGRNQCFVEGKPLDQKNIREVLQDMIQLIRFLTFTEVEIFKYGKQILNANEINIIVKCINGETEVKSLDYLCRSSIKRKNISAVFNDLTFHDSLSFSPSKEIALVASNRIKSSQFKIRRPITLISVTVPTRASTGKNTDRYYFEDLIIQLNDCQTNKTYFGEFAGKVAYNSKIQVPFANTNSEFPIFKLHNLHICEFKIIFKSKAIYYYPLRQCDPSHSRYSDFEKVGDSLSFIIGIDYVTEAEK